MASKPTLGSLLVNPQKESSTIQQMSNEKIVFPKINTKLKKTHFTKYRSAFIDLQPNHDSQNQQQRQSELNAYHKEKKQSKKKQMLSKKVNTEGVQNERRNGLSSEINKEMNSEIKREINAEMKRGGWKLNRKKNESYQMEGSETVNLHSNNKSVGKVGELGSLRSEELMGVNSFGREKLMDAFLNETEVVNKSVNGQNSNKRFTLLTQIRELNISPIEPMGLEQKQADPRQRMKDPRQRMNKHKEINEKIEKSNRIISLIQSNYKKGFFQSKDKDQSSIQKLQQKLGLFSYLKREFVTKRQQLTNSKLNHYFNSPSNKKLQAKINFNTREFLIDKLHNDYHSYREVDRLRQNLSTNAVKDEIKHKTKLFNQEYNKKYNVPYLSFLSLPKNLKIKVLQKITQNPNSTTHRSNYSTQN